MSDLRPAVCPISGIGVAKLVCTLSAPPHGEIGFEGLAGDFYHREIWQFEPSNHFVSCHEMDVTTGYTGAYVNAAYTDDAGIRRAFRRIISLPPEKSDNAGRVRRLRAIAEARFGRADGIKLLDVGSGLGVFPYAVKQLGWECTALDPDQRAARHISENVGVSSVCSDFLAAENLGKFNIVTFNKVLEHVADPVSMLSHAHKFLGRGGLVYLELPDGEMAAREGFEREEFFIEHLHIFSFGSVVNLVNLAGFTPFLIERLREPSTKYTLRAYCVAGDLVLERA